MPRELSDDRAQSRYEIRIDGEVGGFVQYRLGCGTITLYHTEIKPEFEGRGLGSELARETLADVRTRGLEVVPLCPFIAAYICRHPDLYLDLVSEGMRERKCHGGDDA